jgi:3-dehydroquinate dehydratase-2
LKSVLIINGPNLNLLGTREPLLYGSQSFDDFLVEMKKEYPEASVDYIQKNTEGEIVEAIQSGSEFDAVILNPAAFSHTSLAIADAVAAIETPVYEVHISNIFARDTRRHHSMVSKYAKGIVAGVGLDGYKMIMDQIMRR